MMEKIAFVDLEFQQQRIREKLGKRMADVLAHGKYIMGPEVAEFESQLEAFSGAKSAITCANGTDALTMLLMTWGVGTGDAVFVPSFTFTATAEVAVLLGATPVFVDVDPHSFNLCPQSYAEQIEKVLSVGKLRPAVVVAADLFGLPADYPELNRISNQYGIKVLADAAQSFGASRGDKRVGVMADGTATSFFPAKPLGCYGDGGAVLVNDDAYADALRSIRSHGKGGEKYDIVRVGLNSRLDTLQAAILLCKLEIFQDEIERRNRVAAKYDEVLPNSLMRPARYGETTSVWAQYTLKSDHRDLCIDALKDSNIPSAIYYPRPMHLQTAYQQFGNGEGSLPVSEALCKQVFSLPMHPYIEVDQVERVAEALSRIE